MGASPSPNLPPIALALKGMILQNKVKRRQWKKRRSIGSGSTQRRILMKRRALLDGSRRFRSDGVSRRVRTLRRLVPNTQSMGLDSLFRETAGYIMRLQMRVEVMKAMVDVLSTCD